MKLSQKIIVGLSLTIVAGMVAYALSRRCGTDHKMLSQISDEGYETAHDVLFPGRRIQGRKVHYGPVIPRS